MWIGTKQHEQLFCESLETRLAENGHRLALFPPALLRPRLMPAPARTFLRTLRAVPSKGGVGVPARGGQSS